MADSFCIRASGLDDIGAITAIYRHAVLHGTGTFEIEPPDHDEMAARHARTAGQAYPFLVACAEDAVVGYAYAFAYRDRPAYRFCVEDSIYVHPDWQGRGIATMLLRRLVVAAEASGFRQMIAVIGDSANLGSVKLHRAAGFAPLGTLKSAGWKFERWLDVVLMQRALGPGDGVPPAEP